MKLCIFQGDQKDMVTSLNPIEMASSGVFENDFSFLKPEHLAKLDLEMQKANRNYPEHEAFLRDASDMSEEVEHIISNEQGWLHRQFFNWYIGFYYKIPGWEREYPEWVNRYPGIVSKLFKMLKTEPKSNVDHVKQTLMEFGWLYTINPDILSEAKKGRDRELLLEMDRRKVKSSNIQSVGYHKDTQTMVIEFIGDKLYSYTPITPEGFNKFMQADSLGKFFFANIRNNKDITTTLLRD
jgi:hypothetical protein